MDDDPTTRRRKRTAAIAQAYRTSHEVMSAAIGIALFAGCGFWLDGQLNSKPACTIAGAILGCVFAGFSLQRLLIRLDQESARRKQQRSDNTKAQGE